MEKQVIIPLWEYDQLKKANEKLSLILSGKEKSNIVYLFRRVGWMDFSGAEKLIIGEDAKEQIAIHLIEMTKKVDRLEKQIMEQMEIIINLKKQTWWSKLCNTIREKYL